MRALFVFVVGGLLMGLPVGAWGTGPADPASGAVTGATGGLDFGAEETHVFTLEGSGWGRIELTFLVDATLSIDLYHEDIPDLSFFEDIGYGLYDEGNYTMVYLHPADAVPTTLSSSYTYTGNSGGAGLSYANSGRFFHWWGTPEWPAWPAGNMEGTMQVSAGDRYALLAANTVAGYEIVLRTGPLRDPSVHTWELGPHPEHRLFVPAAAERSIVDSDVADLGRERSWSADAVDVPPAVALVNSWTLREAMTVRAGTRSDSLDANPQGDCAAQPSPFSLVEEVLEEAPGPSWSTLTGGFSYATSLNTIARLTECDYAFERRLVENHVGVENVLEGAAFLTIPLQPAG